MKKSWIGKEKLKSYKKLTTKKVSKKQELIEGQFSKIPKTVADPFSNSNGRSQQYKLI